MKKVKVIYKILGYFVRKVTKFNRYHFSSNIINSLASVKEIKTLHGKIFHYHQVIYITIKEEHLI